MKRLPIQRRTLTLLAVLLPIALMFLAAWSTAGAQPATANTHRPVAASQAQLQLDHGRRWPTDVTLRDGMRHIRAVSLWIQSAQVDGALSTRQSRAASVSIEDSVATIVKHPSRGAGTDANLHILLGRVLAADGLPQLRSALELYPRYFDDAEWQSAQHNPQLDH